MSPAHTVYPPHERPEVEVLVDGTWHYGTLRMWKLDGDTWTGSVTWSAPDGNRIDDFDSEHIRPLPDPYPPDATRPVTDWPTRPR